MVPVQSVPRTVNEVVRRSWFTHISDAEGDDEAHGGSMDVARQITPSAAADRYDVDDSFRNSVSLKLRGRTNDDPLPSTNYLNLSVQIYFAKFNAIFPVIHSQTFRPTPKNSLLLLSICSMGSLLIGSQGAAAQGSKIFERLNKAILASWESSVLKDPAEAVSTIQAALIGQTFGLLSGEPKHLAIVEAFHGTVIAWARRCNMFTRTNSCPDLSGLSGTELNSLWKTWARSEEIIRTVLGLYVHDAELASMLHHEPLLRHDSIALSVAADDSVFNAPTAAAWKEQMLLRQDSKLPIRNCLHVNMEFHHYSQPLPSELVCTPSSFTAYVILHGISAGVCEQQQSGRLDLSSTNFSKHYDTLMCWYFTFQAGKNTWSKDDVVPGDPFYLMILWHTVFMNLLADFNILERAIGRDGLRVDSSEQDHVYAVQWASSSQAIEDSFREPALEFPEFSIRGAPIPKHLFGAASGQSSDRVGHDGEPTRSRQQRSGPVVPLGAGMLCTLTDMLHRIGHWAIARKFAAILEMLVRADTDEDWMLT
ncbi:hypothetical protein B0A49_08116 [Cryomyces minteri]|uniref:Xylanolytic transcriptional activator regulatory domain-containing protein n=1 Tax=Cryomyces minteri TaxID=331657 RepID=A0A4U0WTG1_9PEZI|nr:hypothetical protein B0A49_08116 [Cryomyces minteri]